MKLSLWQQFSSNHSGAYTIVGVFRTPEAAQEARTVILKILHDIDAWNQQNPVTPRDLNPVEQAYEKTYGIQWQEPIDWLLPVYREYLQGQLEDFVLLFDRAVFIVSYSNYTYQTGHQFADLMTALGADIYDSIFMGYTPDDEVVFTRLRFRVVCTAPTDMIADEIYTGLLDKKTQHQSSTLTRDGLQITLEENETEDTAYILSSLISWMQSKGCVATYQFLQQEA